MNLWLPDTKEKDVGQQTFLNYQPANTIRDEYGSRLTEWDFSKPKWFYKAIKRRLNLSHHYELDQQIAGCQAQH